MSNAMTKEDYIAKTRAMTQLLLGAIPQEMPHNALLEALLMVYISVAETHPCCTQGAAQAMSKASIRLLQAELQRPTGVPVH